MKTLLPFTTAFDTRAGLMGSNGDICVLRNLDACVDFLERKWLPVLSENQVCFFRHLEAQCEAD